MTLVVHQGFEQLADKLSDLYCRPENHNAAKKQLKNATQFISTNGNISLVPIHRVILRLRGYDMLMPNRSGQELLRYRSDLRELGYAEVNDSDDGFDDIWEEYLQILHKIGVGGPSSGTPSSRAVRTFFYKSNRSSQSLSPEDFIEATYLEGAETQITRNIRERDPNARADCINLYRKLNGGKLMCLACEFDFSKNYGEVGTGFIHVHHLDPLAEASGPRWVDPSIDLVPLCPNCHAMVHRRRPQLTIKELVELMKCPTAEMAG